MEHNLTETDLRHCLALATEALQAGDEPFGSLLVSEQGQVLATARNRVNELNALAHPEIELAHWAAAPLPPAERARTTPLHYRRALPHARRRARLGRAGQNRVSQLRAAAHALASRDAGPRRAHPVFAGAGAYCGGRSGRPGRRRAAASH
ncbi:MAG: hypothetical protein WKG07_31695 [Hymenobacter sp.]